MIQGILSNGSPRESRNTSTRYAPHSSGSKVASVVWPQNFCRLEAQCRNAAPDFKFWFSANSISSLWICLQRQMKPFGSLNIHADIRRVPATARQQALLCEFVSLSSSVSPHNPEDRVVIVEFDFQDFIPTSPRR
jgi:hypothetical protein